MPKVENETCTDPRIFSFEQYVSKLSLCTNSVSLGGGIIFAIAGKIIEMDIGKRNFHQFLLKPIYLIPNLEIYS